MLNPRLFGLSLEWCPNERMKNYYFQMKTVGGVWPAVASVIASRPFLPKHEKTNSKSLFLSTRHKLYVFFCRYHKSDHLSFFRLYHQVNLSSRLRILVSARLNSGNGTTTTSTVSIAKKGQKKMPLYFLFIRGKDEWSFPLFHLSFWWHLWPYFSRRLGR